MVRSWTSRPWPHMIALSRVQGNGLSLVAHAGRVVYDATPCAKGTVSTTAARRIRFRNVYPSRL